MGAGERRVGKHKLQITKAIGVWGRNLKRQQMRFKSGVPLCPGTG